MTQIFPKESETREDLKVNGKAGPGFQFLNELGCIQLEAESTPGP
jgi:hypothetical protein